MAYLRLLNPPVMWTFDPVCGTCTTTLDSDGDGWVCKSCGSSWSYNNGDGEYGTLAPPEETEGPALCANTAFYAHAMTTEQRARHTQACDCDEH